ncbi:MAG TPA: polyphosphate kinase 2 family protein [Hyphomonas sp.]|mgnify:CR=1|nr:polyphosphate kinase 2 family protein [Hyphomonas sp.]
MGKKIEIPSIDDVRKHLIAPPGKKFNLAERNTADRALFGDKEDAKTSLKKDAAVINELKDVLYAIKKQSVLVILQGMDTAGKSGTIKSVFANTTPLGMEVKAFKAPSSNELARDYLWRVHNAVPQKGHVGIFDRSHYEDVLVVKVRKFADPAAVEQRYDQINAFEKHITENGVAIVKCMLNIGYAEQGVRLSERLSEAHKLWKFNPADLEDRRMWPDFMAAYETAVERCSTEHAPWYIIPADSRTRRSALIARLVRGALEDMHLEWPDPGLNPADYEIG